MSCLLHHIDIKVKKYYSDGYDKLSRAVGSNLVGCSNSVSIDCLRSTNTIWPRSVKCYLTPETAHT